jgi:adenosylcobinamide-phosphate synthase
VARFGIERLCADLVRGLAAPLFWYLLLGLPGVLFSTAVAATALNLADQRSSPSFVRVPQLVDGALNMPAALITAILIALASAFIPGGRPSRAIGELSGEIGRRPSQSLRWPSASAAGALGLALGGRSSYAGWIGRGTARATSGDLRRMMLAAALCCLFAAMLMAALAALSLAADQ